MATTETKQLAAELAKLGLSDKEAQVYVTLLNEGATAAEALAKRAKLNRSTTYVQLKTLMSLGFVSTFKRGTKTLFEAESPNNLDRLLERQTLELEAQRNRAKLLIPDLMQLYGSAGIRPVIRTFEGKQGLMSMRQNLLNQNCRELYIASDIDALYNIFTREELMAHSLQRVKMNIKSYVLYNKEGEDALLVPPQELKRLPKDKFPFSSDVYISGDTVSFTNCKDDIVGVTIQNKQIAESMLAIFKLAWSAT